MKNNNFYRCPNYLLIYETKELAQQAWQKFIDCLNRNDLIDDAAATSFHMENKGAVAFWTRYLKTKVLFSLPEEPVLVLKKEQEFWNVIIGEKIGWIIDCEWIELERIEENNEKMAKTLDC